MHQAVGCRKPKRILGLAVMARGRRFLLMVVNGCDTIRRRCACFHAISRPAPLRKRLVMPDRIELCGHLFRVSRYRGWEAVIPLQGWASDGGTAEITVSISRGFQPDGKAKTDPPTAEQAAALKYLLDHQVQTAHAALKATLLYVKELFNENKDWYDFFDVPESEHDILSIMEVPCIEIHDQSVDGFAWIGIAAGCEWEEEHGCGIAMWKGLVLDIGDGDVATSLAVEPVPMQDELQDERRRVVDLLCRQAELTEQAAEAEFLAALPPSVRLVQAILSRQADEAERLLREGVDINVKVKPYEPAIFMALDSQEPDIVSAMIEAGASLNVKNRDRQTPLEFAKQMVKTHTLGCQMRAGGADALNAMMANLMGGQSLFGDGSREEPLKQMQDNLQAMGAQGGIFSAVAGKMQNMLSQLAGGMEERMKDAAPQEREYLKNVMHEGDLMLANWKQIQRLIEDRLARA